MATRRHKYAGPHLWLALRCMDEGRPNIAAEWMSRDIGEEWPPTYYPVVDSLRVEPDDFPSRLRRIITYETVGEAMAGVGGDGI